MAATRDQTDTVIVAIDWLLRQGAPNKDEFALLPSTIASENYELSCP